MGRFYKTASANPLDYMHRINAPLMERALQFNDQAISAQAEQGQAVGNAALNFKRLADDDPDAALIAKQYNDQVDQLSKTMAADPANWRKQMEPLRTLKKDILDNYSTGPIAKMQANYGAYQGWKTKIDKAVEKGTIDPNTAKTYEDYYLNNWRKNGPTGFKNGRYNVLKMDDVMVNMDIKKKVAEGFDKVKADLNATETYHNSGMYLIKDGNSTKTVSKAKLMELGMANLQDPLLQNYMRSRQQVGLLRNVYDEKGDFINPVSGYGVDPEAIARANKIIEQTKIADPKKAAQMQAELDAYAQSESNNPRYNPNSGLSGIISGVVNSSAWSERKQTQDIKADPVLFPSWMQGRKEAQQIADRNVRVGMFNEKQKTSQNNFDKRLDWDKEKTRLQLEAKVNAGTGKGKLAKTKVADMFAKEYLGDVAAPDHNFVDDIPAFSSGDLSAVNRVKEAVKVAVEGVVKDAPSHDKKNAEAYMEFLTRHSYKQSNPERAKEFIDELSAKTPGYNGNAATRLNYLEPIIKKIGDSYNSKVNDWYSTANADVSKTDITAFTPEAKTSLANTLNATPQYYFSIDDKGNQVSLSTDKTGTTSLGKITSVEGGTAGNAQGKLGFRATFEDGETRWIFPSEDENVYNTSKNLMLGSIQDKNSVLAVNLKSEMVNNIRTSLAQGRVVQGGKQNIINLNGHQLPAVLNSDGSVMLKDSDGNDMWEKPVSSIAKLVELMTATKPELDKK